MLFNERNQAANMSIFPFDFLPLKWKHLMPLALDFIHI